MGAEVKWIPVTVDDGMFTDEYAVTIRLFGGGNVSLFADKSMIREYEGVHHLKVTVMCKETCPDRMRVLLPSETFETSSPWVDVPC